MRGTVPAFLSLALLRLWFVLRVDAFGVSSRFFVKQQNPAAPASGGNPPGPKLILIGGPPGTGKSTFGMSVALDQGILKCISTDTVRAVMRSFVSEDISPALHRSSYAAAFEGDDPVRSWRETCSVLATSVEGLIDDAMKRRQSIVVEGVHVVPCNKLIEKWREMGGTAIGCILQIANEEKHKKQLRRRGVMTGVHEAEEDKIAHFHRIRCIQDEMIRLAKENDWLQIEQRTAPDPLDVVGAALYGDGTGASDILDECMAMEEEEDLQLLESERDAAMVNGGNGGGYAAKAMKGDMVS